MKRSCCGERQKRGNLLLAAIVVAEKMELRLTPGRIQGLRFTMPLTDMVSYSKLKILVRKPEGKRPPGRSKV
jgi:hypothetical protein